jgi:hypothetical protein
MLDSADLEAVAIAALRAVASDRNAPAAARAAAARTLLETCGRIGRLQETAPTDARPLDEMSASELSEEIQRLRAARRAEPGTEPGDRAGDPDPFAPDTEGEPPEGETLDPFEGV